MTTIGERIKRARLARNMSGEELALAVGYKQQSAIGNLENRGGGTGGKKLPDIARALRVPLNWLLEGPDDGPVPYAEPMGTATQATIVTRLGEPALASYGLDASMLEATDLYKQLKTEQRLKAITYMRALLAGAHTGSNEEGLGESDSVPHSKKAA